MQFLFWCLRGDVVAACNLEIQCERLCDACCAFRMLSSAISALFLSYYRLPTRPELRERDPRLSLGSLGLGTESAMRFWIDFGLIFLPFRRPLEPHGHSGNAKICGLVSKICKGSVSVMKTVKIAFPVGPWGSRGRKFELFEFFYFLVFRFG